jgi:hypothetical protein
MFSFPTIFSTVLELWYKLPSGYSTRVQNPLPTDKFMPQILYKLWIAIQLVCPPIKMLVVRYDMRAAQIERIKCTCHGYHRILGDETDLSAGGVVWWMHVSSRYDVNTEGKDKACGLRLIDWQQGSKWVSLLMLCCSTCCRRAALIGYVYPFIRSMAPLSECRKTSETDLIPSISSLQSLPNLLVVIDDHAYSLRSASRAKRMMRILGR